ncbi:hypothetical protein [Streptomyces mayteni]
MRRFVVRGALGAAATAFLLVATSAPANAVNVPESRNLLDPPSCESPSGSSFRFSFRYNSNLAGSWKNLGYAHANFAATDIGVGDPFDYPLEFCSGTGNGAGQGIKNNAASARNRHSSYSGRVYYNSWWQGAYNNFLPGTSGNLTSTYNNNASFQWL